MLAFARLQSRMEWTGAGRRVFLFGLYDQSAGESMDLLNIFALIVLVTLVVSIVAGALVVGWLPGRIASRRGHPQADAIAVCGWLGLLTLGILLPIAYIWAFLKSSPEAAAAKPASGPPTPPATESGE